MRVRVYTDGSSTGRVGPGGWGYLVLVDDRLRQHDHGGALGTTNNVMEVTAAIKGLAWVRLCLQDYVPGRDSLELVSDSQYVLGMASGRWKPKINHDLVHDLQVLFCYLRARPVWMPGHSGNAYNECVDALAKAGRDEIVLTPPGETVTVGP